MSDNRAHLERLLRYERGGGDAAERRAVAEWLDDDATARRAHPAEGRRHP